MSDAFGAGDEITVAVVTGHHPFDVPNFHRLFRAMPGIDAYPQELAEFASDAGNVRQRYDVLVFYNMHTEMPDDEGPWWETGLKAALEELGRTRQGIVLLHHAILAFPQWQAWSEMVGIADRSFQFFLGQRLHVEVTDPNHPITAGMHDWDMIDETYVMAEPGAGSEVLLTVEHPNSTRAIAWTRRDRQGRLFCLQSGHDNGTWATPSFRTVLERGIRWAAGKI